MYEYNSNCYLYFVEGTNLGIFFYVSFTVNLIPQTHYVGLPASP